MNAHTMHKITMSLVLGGTLSVASNMVIATVSQSPVQISQTPLSVGASGSPPNIMLMVDNSGSMGTDSPKITVPATDLPNTMPGDYKYNCNSPVTSYAPTVTYMTVSGASPKFCTAKSGVNGDICKGTPVSFGNTGSAKCFDNSKNYTVTYSNTSSVTGTSLGTYTGAQLNWYFYNNSFSSTSGNMTAVSSSLLRIEMAKKAANNLINSLIPAPGDPIKVRMGLAGYNQDDESKGGSLYVPIADLNDTQATTLTTKVDSLSASNFTPLATTLMTIGRYFTTGYSGKLTLHPNSATPTSDTINNIFNGLSFENKTGATLPTTDTIQNYCQKNATILISDGLPNKDREVGTILADYTGDCGVLKKCDSTNTGYTVGFPDILPTSKPTAASTPTTFTPPTPTSIDQGPNSCGTYNTNANVNRVFPPYNLVCKNGSKTGRAYENGGSDYLDDVAAALYDMDIRPDFRLAHPGTPKQNISTYTIAIADLDVKAQVRPSNGGTGNEAIGTVLEDAAKQGGGSFVFAENYQQLAAALDAMVASIRKGIGSFSTIAANSTQLTANTALYLAAYDTADWTGDLSAIPLDSSTGAPLSISWNAGAIIVPPTVAPSVPSVTLSTGQTEWLARNIFTYNPTTDTGITFKSQPAGTICGSLTAKQQSALGITNCNNASDTGLWRLDYLRGDISHEVVNTALGYKNTAGTADPRLTNNTAANRIFRNRVRYRQSDSVSVTPAYKAGDVWYDPWLLGDIVNSGVLFVGTQDYGYGKTTATGLTAAERDSYAAFVGSPATTTPSAPATGKYLWKSIVYVGANDGLLHGFDATVPGGGSEILAYMPSSIFDTNGRLKNLSSPTYDHKYFVDGTPRATDVYFGGAWHTVMVGTTGAGGSGIFALDVSDPTTFSVKTTAKPTANDDVLWEINSAETPNTADASSFADNLGYSLPQVSVGRMNDGSWAAIVANGYVSTKNKAVLYILNIQTGKIIATFDTLTGSPSAANGLSTPFSADVDGNGTIDAIYAGDLLGNMWKFDVSSSNINQWKIAYGTNQAPAPLFTACLNGTSTDTCDASRQPITNKPQVGSVSSSQTTGGVMVYFGTGKYFEDTDNNSNTSTQTFYGIWDKCPLTQKPDTVTSTTSTSPSSVCNTSVPSPVRNSTTSALVQQTIDVQTTSAPFVRGTSNNTIDWTSKQGWYIDFVNPNTNKNDGERLVSASILRSGRIIFSTIIPIPTNNPDVCSRTSSSTSWVMALDAITGGRPKDQVLGTQMVNLKDGTSVPVSGEQTTGGSMGTPVIISGPNGSQLDGGNSSGGLEQKKINLGSQSSSGAGRQSWRQL